MKVKPLEWKPDPVFGGERGMIGNVAYRHVRWDYGGARYGFDNYPTMEAAKAAAQAEHEAYIMNAIDRGKIDDNSV